MNLVASLKNVLDKISSKQRSRWATEVMVRILTPHPLLLTSLLTLDFATPGVRRLTNMLLRLTRDTYDKAQHELFEKSIRMYIKGRIKSIWQSTSRNSPTFSKNRGNRLSRRYRRTSSILLRRT